MTDSAAPVLERTRFSIDHFQLLLSRVAEYVNVQLSSPAHSKEARNLLEWAAGRTHVLSEELDGLRGDAERLAGASLARGDRQPGAVEARVLAVASDFHDLHFIVSIASRTSAFDVPSPVALSIADLAHEFDHRAAVVVIPLPIYNYVHMRRTDLPPQYCVLALPYTGHEDPLSACLLFHELGHFLARSIGFRGRLVESAGSDLTADIVLSVHHFLRQLREAAPRAEVPAPEDVINVVFRWCEEAFADCFGLHAGGAAYTAAMWAYPRDVKLRRPQVLPGDHPPLEKRLAIILRAARDDHGADLHEKIWCPEATRFMSWVRSLAESVPSLTPLEELCCQCLDRLSDTIFSVLAGVFAEHTQLRFNVALFGAEAEEVRKRFYDLSVAGQILRKGERPMVPEWRTLLNCGWELMLSDFKEWSGAFTPEPAKAQRHTLFVEKLCAITLKSIEDTMICRTWEGAGNVRLEPE